jgi:hypothetical protein
MTMRSPLRAPLAVLALGTLLLAAPALGAQAAPAAPAATPRDSGVLEVTRPTVVAYFVIPPGAVDTNPDLATTADDWNYAMSILGDSVEARGFGFTMWIDPQIVIRRPGRARLDTVALGKVGYVFVPPTGVPCVGHGWMDPDELVAAATRFFAARAEARRCTLPQRPD